MRDLHEMIRRDGPLPFEAFMRHVLCHPEGGYYATRVPGSGGDYGTAPSLTPWFGRLVARELRAMWDALGRPDPFTVIEAGARRAGLPAALLGCGGHLGGVRAWAFRRRLRGGVRLC